LFIFKSELKFINDQINYFNDKNWGYPLYKHSAGRLMYASKDII
jgi:hypothetical protein